MRLSYKHIVLFGVLMAGLVSCRQDEPVHSVPLELNLCLPAQEAGYHAPIRRSIGDPGGNEVLSLPKYAYIIVTKEEGGVGSIWRKEEIKLDGDSWEKIRYYGLYDTDGDYIYRYKKRAIFLLSDDTPKGKIYVICSTKQLTMSPSFASISTLDDIMNLKFNTAPDSIQENLQNIYSTPYNYTKGGNYYCMYDCSEGNVYSTDLLLYHIAAKVDIKWKVAENKRLDKSDPTTKGTAVRLTYMKVQNLFNDYAYCFKPMENVQGAKLSSGFEREIVTNATEGLWWEGRSYFYTIPYTTTENPDYFPLQMVLKTNGSSSTGYQPTLNLRIDTSTPFVPWLRADFNITGPLTDKEETKIIDEKTI